MDSTALVLVAALSLVAALVLAAVALVALRQGRGGGEAEVLQKQIPASIESLRGEVRASLDGATQTLNQRMAQLSAEVDRRLSEVGGDMGRRLDSTSRMLGERLEGAAKAVADVHQKLGTVEGATQRILEVGKDIASLQQILRAPKLRGGLGEIFLGELLGQILPAASFELQRSFRGGQRCDAVVKVGERLVPIDAKFPLENFARLAGADDDASRAAARRGFVADVKKRIDEIADKYIVPEEGTFDFALMYVPAENVWYETIVRADEGSTGNALYEYSLEKRVIPVSPNTLYSYLQVIVLGLRGLAIEERAQEILRGIGGVAGEMERFRSDFQTLGRHVEDAAKKFAEAGRRLQRVEDGLRSLGSLDDGSGRSGGPDGR